MKSDRFRLSTDVRAPTMAARAGLPAFNAAVRPMRRVTPVAIARHRQAPVRHNAAAASAHP